MQAFRHVLVGAALAATLAAPFSAWAVDRQHRPAPTGSDSNERAFCTHLLDGQLFARTELFFGRNRPGGVVSEAEFQQFLDEQVTPRFPDGLTVVEAKGQFRSVPNAPPEREDAKLLVLLYPFDRHASDLIEEIRSAYKGQFQQQSVLRVDEQSCTSF